MFSLRLLSVLLIFICLPTASADNQSHLPIVETEWLAKNLSSVVVLDVRTSKKSYVTPAMFSTGE